MNRFEVKATAGTHHVNVFRVQTNTILNAKPGDVIRGTTVDPTNPCINLNIIQDWQQIINSQLGGSTYDWTLPENVAERLTGGEILMLQVHYVNAVSLKTPTVANVSVNMWTSTGAPTHELGARAGFDRKVHFCPGEGKKSFTQQCLFPKDAQRTIVAINGHAHSRLLDFTADLIDPSLQVTVPKFYESSNWDEPVMKTGMSLQMDAGAGFQWTCDFEAPTGSCGNPDDSCCFNFGNAVETNEHCNVRIYYYPAENVQWVNGVPCGSFSGHRLQRRRIRHGGTDLLSGARLVLCAPLGMTCQSTLRFWGRGRSPTVRWLRR